MKHFLSAINTILESNRKGKLQSKFAKKKNYSSFLNNSYWNSKCSKNIWKEIMENDALNEDMEKWLREE
jgi:hypothetical protein